MLAKTTNGYFFLLILSFIRLAERDGITVSLNYGFCLRERMQNEMFLDSIT